MKPLFVIWYLSIAFYGCGGKSKIDSALIYSTLNEIILLDSISARIVCHKFDQVRIFGVIRKKFFQDENEFIERRMNNSVNAFVASGRLYFFSRKKGVLEKSFIDTTCSKNIFYRISYPIFSRDLQTVVVGITQDCDCMLGGWSFTGVYKRKKGKWVKVMEYDRWIS